MRILAIEFSSLVRSVAVLDLAPVSSQPVVLANASDEGNREVKPLTLINHALKEARVEREVIERLVIGLGPGSYTGIRSAIAVAQGWELAQSVALIGASSAEGLAVAAQAQGWHGRVGVVIDAQRGEFYFAGFEISDSGCRATEALRIMKKEEASGVASAYATLVGPEVTRFFPTGRILHPEAKHLGPSAVERSDFTLGEKMEPIYLRETTFVKAPKPRTVASP